MRLVKFLERLVQSNYYLFDYFFIVYLFIQFYCLKKLFELYLIQIKLFYAPILKITFDKEIIIKLVAYRFCNQLK